MTLADEISSIFEDFETFTFGDVRIAFAGRGRKISDKTIQVTISRMVKKGRLHTVIKGVFSQQKRPELAGFAFAPFYYGGLAALMIADLIDDQVKMEIMTTRRVKRSLVSIYKGDSAVVLHHIPKKYYFGFRDMKYGDLTVPVSDPEKTLIDMFYYKQKLSLQDYSGLLKIIRKSVLHEYLKHYDKRAAKTVLNFVRRYKPLADADKLETGY